MNIAPRNRGDRPCPSLRRERLLADLDAEGGVLWRTAHEPGTYGCDELLDRIALIANNLDDWVVANPSCLMNAEWYETASSALDILWDLYHKIGDAHLDGDDRPWSRRDFQGNPS